MKWTRARDTDPTYTATRNGHAFHAHETPTGLWNMRHHTNGLYAGTYTGTPDQMTAIADSLSTHRTRR